MPKGVEMRVARLWLFCGVAACVAALALVRPGAIFAADTDAPPGAPPYWLPNEDWVQNRWLPYDEADLFRLMHSSREEVRLWLDNPTHTLDDLARLKGLDAAWIQSQLLVRWRARVSKRQFQRLRSRTQRTFTQSHLMLHMLTHVSHVRAFSRRLVSITGVSDKVRAKELARGKSLAEIAAEHGHSFAAIRAVLLKAARANARRGVRLHATPPVEARRLLIAEEKALTGWLTWTRPSSSAARSASFTQSSFAYLCWH